VRKQVEFIKQIVELTNEEAARRVEYEEKVAEIGNCQIISSISCWNKCEIHMSEDGFHRFVEESGLTPVITARNCDTYPHCISALCDGTNVFCICAKLPDWVEAKDAETV
jgi:hypothetical protein